MTKYTVEKGKRYRAKIEIPWAKRPFASVSVVKQNLDEAGFVDVVVKEEGRGVYWAWGTWPGERTSQDVDYVTRLDETAC